MDLRLLFAVIVAGAAIAGCTSELPVVCTQELGVRYRPSDTTITVGQSFTPSVELSSCGGRQVLTDVFTWSSQYPDIATVDSLTGRVVGERPGEGFIRANGEHYGNVGGLWVTVVDSHP